MTKRITIRDGAQPEDVTAVITHTAQELGFALEQVGPTSLIAHDGNREVTGNATATRARLAIDIEPGTVRIDSTATGAAYAGAAGVGFFTARINWRYSKFTRQLRKSLQGADLA